MNLQKKSNRGKSNFSVNKIKRQFPEKKNKKKITKTYIKRIHYIHDTLTLNRLQV